MVTVELLRAHGWQVAADLLDGLTDYEREFMRLEFTGRRTFAYYRSRVRYLGFTGMERVLDAGCGMGQWAVALACHNRQVEGIDLNEGRLGVARKLVSAMGRPNVSLTKGNIEKLPFGASQFDGVFCYGVFMFTEMPRTLSEFSRVLKPGGKLYVNANSFGWYLHLLRDVPWNRRPALGIILNTLRGRTRAIVVREGWLRARLAEHGFRVLAVRSEGDATFAATAPAPKPEPAYPRRYWGLRAILEAIAVRAP